jgi:hypothetical protein
MSASHDTSKKARTAVAQTDIGTAEAAGGVDSPSGKEAVRPERIMGSDSANPTGYWEPPGIVGIHNEMLAAAGSSWDYPAEFSLSWLDSAAAQPFTSRLCGSFAEAFADSSLMLLKDPRICRFVRYGPRY